MNGVTVQFTKRETGQVQFTKQEFLNAISVATGGAARFPEGAKVTGVDVAQFGVTVRLMWESPEAVADDIAPEVSVITRGLHQKLRGVTDREGRPLFYPTCLVDGPDYFDGEPVRTRKQS